MQITSWNQLINSLTDPHLMQTSQWAAVKSRYGWVPHYLVWHHVEDDVVLLISGKSEFEVDRPAAAALILERKVVPGLSVLYCPKGPVLADWSDEYLIDRVLTDLKNFTLQVGAIQLKIDPDVVVGQGVPGEDGSRENSTGLAFQQQLSQHGWQFSTEQIQFRNTVLIDLAGDEDQILARMKSKTRYNIRLSGRKGVNVRLGRENDLPMLYRIYAETSVRGGFTIRGKDYYQALWKTFLNGDPENDDDPCAQPLVAEFEDQPVAGAVIFHFGPRVWYLHGMSLPEHSEKMAPQLIQWEAIRWAKTRGCSVYDMWGAPEQFDESDSLWGVYKFKRGFGGEVSRTIGAWDFPAKPILYTMYTRWLPRILNWMRWFGDRKTMRAITEKL